jgi:hypothetical protein
MLYFRIELAHRILDTVTNAAMETDWEKKLIAELLDWAEMFRDTNELLEPYSNDWLKSHDINSNVLLKDLLLVFPGFAPTITTSKKI